MPEIGEIVAMLAANIDSLAAEMLPGGRRHGHEWMAGSLAGEPGTRVAVRLSGAKAGIWANFAGNERGDALDLIAHCRYGGDKAEALRFARAWLGLEAGTAAPATPRAPPTPPAEQIAAEAEAAERNRQSAMKIWLAGTTRLNGTPVDRYLASRGIALDRLTRHPGAIRYHARLWHAGARDFFPAMVTAIACPGGFTAIHRTYLETRGLIVRKADVNPVKSVLGAYRGGHIALARGESGRPIRDAPDGETLDITEGIEDGLTVAVNAPALRVIAAISLSNLAALELPPQITTLRIWRQRDDKLPALEAFDRAVAAHLAAGRAVLIPRLPAGAKDINDAITRKD